MISFLNVFRTQDPTAFGIIPHYSPECISGAVTESRIYPRLRMEFTDVRYLDCAWKPVAEAVCAE